jgi:uncharacterized membrane protein
LQSMISILLVLITVSVVLWLGHQKHAFINKIVDWFPAILFAYLIPAAITHIFSLDLGKEPIHTFSSVWIIPMAILLVMSALSFRQLRIIGLRPILLFLCGSFSIAVLPILLLLITLSWGKGMYHIIIESEYWKGLVPIVGSWIGGSTSQLVLKELVNCPESLFLTILVLDNVLVNLWTILMFQMIKRTDQLNRRWHINDKIDDFVPDEIITQGKGKVSIILTLGISLLILLVCNIFITAFVWKIIVLSLLGLILGNFLKQWNHGLVIKTGGILIIVIMSILGLKLKFSNFVLPGQIILFVISWLVLHFLFMVWIARILKINMAWVPIASMANLGGISTAPAVTAAYNEEWMPHAICLAILSMVTGTVWGTLTIFLFRFF